jgi:hypothetical protein
MTIMIKMLAAGTGIAALAAAAPAAAQYAYPYGYQQYGYGNAYGYNMTQVAAQRCSAAVQQRLNARTNVGIGGIIGSILGVNTRAATQARVLSVTQIDPDRTRIQVRGLATSGQYAGGYGPYGYGAYGAMGYAYQPDLRFRCNVDYRGYVRDIDIDRRR